MKDQNYQSYILLFDLGPQVHPSDARVHLYGWNSGGGKSRREYDMDARKVPMASWGARGSRHQSDLTSLALTLFSL